MNPAAHRNPRRGASSSTSVLLSRTSVLILALVAIREADDMTHRVGVLEVK